MRLCSLVISLAVVAQLAIAAAADAQLNMPGQRTVRIGFGGGVSVPVGDVEEALESGINGQAYVLFNLGGMPLRFNLGYQKLDVKNALEESTASTQIVSGVGGLRYELLRGPVRPFISAGVGAFSINSDNGTSDAESQLKFGIDGGAGIGFSLGRLEGFIEGRLQNIYTDQGAIDVKSIRVIPVSIGILF